MMRYGSVCSGIESASVAWEPLGWKPAWFAETDKAASRLLAKRFPAVTNLGDMLLLPSRVHSGEIEAPDILVGGTPCQAFSVAGMRRGMADARGQLTMTYVELADAIDEKRGEGNECIAVWENVPGVLNHKENPFGCFLGALAGEDVPLVAPGPRWSNAGCVFGPKRTIAWRVIDAQYFGLAQRRRRVFVVASARDDFDPAAVFLECEGVRRDTPPSREAGQGVAAPLDARAEGGGFPGTDGACGGHVVPVEAFGANNCSGPIAAAAALNAHGGPMGRLDFESETFVVQPPIGFNARMDPCVYGDQTGTLDTDSLTQCIAFNGQQGIPAPYGDCAGTLGHHQASQCVSIAFMGRGSNIDIGQDVTGTLTGNIDRASGSAPCVTVALRTRDGCATAELGGEVAYALKAGDGGGASRPYALQHMAVRRLMPIECERLQGFPDGWTEGQADGPRYKQLGNSKAVPCIRWVGMRIQRQLGFKGALMRLADA